MLHNIFLSKQEQYTDYLSITKTQHSNNQFRNVSKNAIKKGSIYNADFI